MTTFKVGELLVLTSGEYSDSRWHGPFRVAKDIDQHEAVDAFNEHWRTTAPSDREEWERPGTDEFMAWLATTGHIEDVPSREWFLGSYSFEPDFAPVPA